MDPAPIEPPKLSAPARSRGPVIRIKNVFRYLGEPKSTFYSLVKSDPDHPKPFKLGARIAVVYKADCDAYLAKKKRKSEQARMAEEVPA